MQNVTKKLSVGLNGFYYLQTTNDMQNGVRVGDGNRGLAFAVGPEIKYHLGRVPLILKYQKELVSENRPCGNSFWFQLGVPLWGHEH